MEEEISLRQASLQVTADLAKHRPFPVPRFTTQAAVVVIVRAIQRLATEVMEELGEGELAVQQRLEVGPIHTQKMAPPTLAAAVAADKHSNLMPVQAVPAS